MYLVRNFLFAASMLGGATFCHAELVSLSINNTPPNSSLVEVFVDAGLLGDDEVTSTLSGELTLDLLPSAINPATAQIVNFNATVDDEVDFRVDGGLLPAVTVEADAATIQLSLVEPGLPAEIIAGQFTQFENLVGFEGVVTASVTPDPIELSEQEPTLVDFENIGITLDRTSVTLSGSINVEQSIPFEVGFFQINVLLEADGNIEATGAIPSAIYSLSTTGMVTSFADSPDWLRGSAANTNSTPTSIDSIVINGLVADPGPVDLDGTVQTVAGASLDGRIELQNGTLEINGVLETEQNAIVFLHPDTEFQADTLRLGADSLLTLSTSRTHRVEGELTFEPGAELIVLPPEEPGTYDLVTFEALSGDYEGIPLSHVQDGRFQSVVVDSNTIRLIDTQALVGDTDGNGEVEFADFLQLSSAFGSTGDWIDGDFDGNGLIEFADFLALSSNFGQAAALPSSVATPEPTSSTSTLLCFLILFGLRQRDSLTRR